jgi:predicted small lipoprotein YifL
MNGKARRYVNGEVRHDAERGGLSNMRLIASLLLAVVLATGFMLKGCGYKGPLYLPDTAKQPAADEQAKKKSKQQN